MRAARLFRQALVGLLCSAIWLLATAGTSCLVAYDLGSSGIRAGATNAQGSVRIKLEALNLLSGRRPMDEAIEPTVAALRELRARGRFDPECRQLGGGFSAWRIALQQDAEMLARALARIHSESGVPIVVIPQSKEGSYGYQGAHQILGSRLVTTHVLDIGGGSLQVSGKDSSFGEALGQKLWQGELCRALGRTAGSSCTLQPLTREELTRSRALLAERLKGIRAALPGEITMTSVSRPISRSVLPALRKLGVAGIDTESLRLASIAQAIDTLRGRGVEETSLLTGIATPYAAYLLSDLLLVEGLLQATGSDILRVAEIDLTNVPGLFADDRTAAWGEKYDCYLDRLRTMGLEAYFSDPASCK